MKNLKSADLDVSTFLYDADGTDEQIELTEDVCDELSDKKMLWVDVSSRNRETIEKVARTLKLKNAPISALINIVERPKLDKYENFYRFFIISVDTTAKDENIKPLAIDFVVGENFIVTIHEGEVPYLEKFRDLRQGESQLGELDTEGFVTTFLDLHIVTYFEAIEQIEHQVDKFDEIILKHDLNDKDFLQQMVKLRRTASKLRRWFVPQREIFYALSRPDFKPTAESDYAETFHSLNQHFENAIDAIENSRDTVLSLFDLYTTRASHRMNNLIKRLTVITVIIGSLGVVAGVFGMNFENEMFKSHNGFWEAVAGMGIFAFTLGGIAKFMDWI